MAGPRPGRGPRRRGRRRLAKVTALAAHRPRLRGARVQLAESCSGIHRSFRGLGGVFAAPTGPEKPDAQYK